ncbi:MAG: hypothetical protein IPK78_04160 [Rhodospirillales bacterium]|nr:hypothetical protein [Rhodospirillales bacterium]
MDSGDSTIASSGTPDYHARIPKIGDLVNTLRQGFKTTFIAELGIGANSIFLFQVREIYIHDFSRMFALQGSYDPGIIDLPLFPSDEFGLKGAAAIYFSTHNLFTKKLAIIPPRLKRPDIIHRVGTFSHNNTPLTIRHSYKTDIGLPRHFVEHYEDAINIVLRERRPYWTTLVHEYIDVRRSFELLIQDDKFVLEHIPGMWESANRPAPDVILVTRMNARIWRYVAKRTAVFARDSQDCSVEDAPVSRGVVADWMGVVERICRMIRSDLRSLRPLNVHFVQDEEETWQFLNIRKGFTLPDGIVIPNSIHTVESVDDIKSWDGKGALKLRLTVERGEEETLLQIMKLLPREHNKVFVDFGILSHPAIVMREYGIIPLPSYLLRGVESIEHYEYYEIDVTSKASDPAEKIFNETPIIEDLYFHVVVDKEPILPNHLLMVARQKENSIADCAAALHLTGLIKRIESKYLGPGESFIFFERGRAPFCTSGFADQHAHCHLVPQHGFRESVIVDLAHATRAEGPYLFGEACYYARKSDCEYMLFGSESDGFFLKMPADVSPSQKRFFRTFFGKRKVAHAVG